MGVKEMLPKIPELILGILQITFIGIILIGLIAWIGMKFKNKLTHKQKTRWLIAHTIFVIIYFGGVLGAFLLAMSARFTTKYQLIYAAHLFMQYFDWFLIIPGGLGSLFTGIWLAIRTHRGLLKYYWVITKWVGTIGAIAYGGNFMRYAFHDNFYKIFPDNIHPLNNPDYLQNRELLFISFAVAFAILISLLLISYLKPWGKRKFNKVPI